MTTWKIANLERESSTGFVTTVHWICSDVDVDGNSGSVYGSQVLSGELVTPFEELTEAQVVGWVKDALGADTVGSYEDNVSAQIEAAKAPAILNGALEKKE